MVNPATVIATLALIVALGGTSYAMGARISGAQLANRSVDGVKLKKHTITGSEVSVSSFPRVPSAQEADHATNATNAVTATTAATITGPINGKQVQGAVAQATTAADSLHSAEAAAADRLTALSPGQSESGAFSGGGGTSTGGWYGIGITYGRPLTTAIADNHIVDTSATPDPTHCPGAGKAAPGYLCLYFQFHSNTGRIYGYSTDPPYSGVVPSVGVGLYAPITGPSAFANGVWTVTAA
jgi:hypothetical protein